MSRVKLHRSLSLSATLVMLASCGEAALDLELGFHQSEREIVYGDLEDGWDGVGALTLTYPGSGYVGSFCSGALIAPQWVLTAAHCLFDHSGYSVYTEGVRFYVGDDARPTGYSGFPSSGALYQAGGLVVPEGPNGYDPESGENDIGLVWLSEPATGVPTDPYNTADIGFLENNGSAFYVGFGQSESDDGGVKRSVTLPITWVATETYDSGQSSSGVCFGDSGGPGLHNFGGTGGVDWRIIGVNSTVAGDNCAGYGVFSTQTRVDAYYTWIESEISATAPDCNDDSSICVCDEACQDQGWCDNSACQTDTCRDIYVCMVECGDDDACAMNCYNNGSAQGQTELDAMYQCFGNYCQPEPPQPPLSDEEYEACIDEHCLSQIDTCFPVITGDATCEEAYDCLLECPEDDSTCVQTCYETGTATAQAQMDAMWECWDTECGTLEGDAWSDCIYQNCGEEMDACWPPANCVLTGGDCEPGTACYPTATGANDCFTSDDVARGEACDPTIADRLVCADGLICLADSQTTGSCYAFCQLPEDCLTGETCYLFQGSDPPLGYCDVESTCTDVDQDGFCEEEDCDDSNAAVNPDAIESCNDTIDNNCDGFVNEGCSACTDGDQDGYCDDVDCDDANPLVWPDAPENCADGLDNDCDTYADDDDIIDCPSGCPDADGDGFPNGQCGGTDCNDSQPTWFPGAPESCGAAYDMNCDGTTTSCVEVGGACTSNEECRSGVCAPHFVCIDPNASYVPPPRPIDDGGCRSSALGAPIGPMGFALLLLLRRRRR